jgi:precorrin-2 dehydrogenase/sirohydrochlorin ferrochelatase
LAVEARERAVWLNAADDPAHCDVMLPAVVRRGVLTIAVASGGTSPALTRALREHLDATLGPEWAALGELAAEVRRELRAAGRSADGDAWRRALAPDVRDLLATGRVDEARISPRWRRRPGWRRRPSSWSAPWSRYASGWLGSAVSPAVGAGDRGTLAARPQLRELSVRHR